MAHIIDGKAIAAKVKNDIKEEVGKMVANGERAPHLAAILVGHDGASETYVGLKERACAEVGFNSTIYRLEDTVTQSELLGLVEQINNNQEIDGLIVQLPLPDHIDENLVIETISHLKDVDGFHPVNVGKMLLGIDSFLPATPAGILTLIRESGIETSGKHCVIVGRSNIVGKPLANLLSVKGIDCTVTLCHSRTENLKSLTSQADILVAAIGKPKFITGDMVKEGAVVIDVGTTRIEDKSRKSGYYLQGDTDYDALFKKCSYITPVPGGVGPMTIVSLLKNTLKSARNRR